MECQGLDPDALTKFQSAQHRLAAARRRTRGENATSLGVLEAKVTEAHEGLQKELSLKEKVLPLNRMVKISTMKPADIKKMDHRTKAVYMKDFCCETWKDVLAQVEDFKKSKEIFVLPSSNGTLSSMKKTIAENTLDSAVQMKPKKANFVEYVDSSESESDDEPNEMISQMQLQLMVLYEKEVQGEVSYVKVLLSKIAKGMVERNQALIFPFKEAANIVLRKAGSTSDTKKRFTEALKCLDFDDDDENVCYYTDALLNEIRTCHGKALANKMQTYIVKGVSLRI